MCRQAHACDRQLKENKRYAVSNRFEQRSFFLLLWRGFIYIDFFPQFRGS
jgi:hypothetical protein